MLALGVRVRDGACATPDLHGKARADPSLTHADAVKLYPYWPTWRASRRRVPSYVGVGDLPGVAQDGGWSMCKSCSFAERLLAQTFEGVTENPKHPVYAAGPPPRSLHSHRRRKKMSYANINEAAEASPSSSKSLVAPGKMTKTEGRELP